MSKCKYSKELSPKSRKNEQYWASIWLHSVLHNTKASWIEMEKHIHQNLHEMPSVSVSKEDIINSVRKMKNWISPGIDGIHNYWWKSLTSTHKTLATLMEQALVNPHRIPKYFTKGIIIMILKKRDLYKPENYRPIT